MKKAPAWTAIGGSFAAALLLVSATAVAERGAPPRRPAYSFPTNAGVRGVQGRIYVKAEPDRVWAVLMDRNKAATMFADVESITPTSKGTTFLNYNIVSPLGRDTVLCEVETRETKRARILTWKRVGGDFAELAGTFRVSADARYPGHTLIVFTNYVDPGGIARIAIGDRWRRRQIDFMAKQMRALVE